MTGCYIDESATDSNLPIAVVAGLLLDGKGFFWLGQEWEKILAQHHIPGPIHMREFVPHGRFKDLTHDARRALFADLVKAINNNKLMSIAGTLAADQYCKTFKGITKLSMYAACFCNVAMACCVGLNKYGQHRWPLSFTLDDGNSYKQQVVESKPVILRAFPRVSKICFESDDNLTVLQAADVLSWAVRRSSSATLKHGFEPLEDLFDEQYLKVEYKEEWMKGVAEKIKAAESEDNSPGQSQQDCQASLEG